MPSFALGLTYVVGLLIAWLASRSYTSIQFNRKYRLPPRVAGVPFFGNTFQLPSLGAGEWAREQALKYGEMFTCQFGGKTWVFLNSSQAVNDLMDKRSSLYSSRPDAPMAFDTMSEGNSILFMPYGDTWRAQRKAFHSILNKTNMSSFAPYQDLESKQFLLDVLHRPDRWHQAASRYANAVITAITFGRRLQPGEGITEEVLDLAVDISAALMPGTWIVDSYTVLDKLPRPLKWWKPAGEKIRDKSKRLFGAMAQESLDAGARGERQDCFVNQFFRSEEGQKLSEDIKIYMLGDLMQGGTDTTSASSSIILAAVATHPRTVRRAREELDRVCGTHADGLRLPEFADRARLPYIAAILKEALRWRPILRIGLGHALSKDDEYKGYRFPAGTVFTWNAWHISQNPDEFEDPDEFKPERFLNKDVESVLKGHLNFGPGRRVCAGYNVADTNLWILAARLLYCFDTELDQPFDTVRDTELFKIQESTGLPFPITIKPRSPAHAALIEKSAAEAGLVG